MPVRRMERYKIPVLIVALLKVAPLFAQFDFPSMSGASAAMGGASVMLCDEESALFNMAGLAWSESPMVSLSARHNVLSEGIGHASVGFSVPIGFGSVGASMIHYGNADYGEWQYSVVYGIPISPSVSAGAGFHYLRSSTSDPYYEPLGRATFSLAMQYKPSDRMVVGFKAFNPIAVMAESDEGVPIPAIFALGVACWLRDELMAVAEIEKNIYYSPSLRIGLDYHFLDYYYARIGVGTQPAIYTFGAGMQRDHLGTSMSVQVHSLMGTTPQLSLRYLF